MVISTCNSDFHSTATHLLWRSGKNPSPCVVGGIARESSTYTTKLILQPQELSCCFKEVIFLLRLNTRSLYQSKYWRILMRMQSHLMAPNTKSTLTMKHHHCWCLKMLYVLNKWRGKIPASSNSWIHQEKLSETSVHPNQSEGQRYPATLLRYTFRVCFKYWYQKPWRQKSKTELYAFLLVQLSLPGILFPSYPFMV